MFCYPTTGSGQKARNSAVSSAADHKIRAQTVEDEYDILNNGDTLASGDCKPNHASNTNVYVCRYTVASGNNGAFAVKAGTNSVDKADNALAAVYTHSAALVLDTTAPAAPVSLAAAPGDKKVRLTWGHPSPADATIVKWQHRRKSTGAYGNWQDVPGGGLARWVEVGSLSNGTAYTFQVRAVDEATNEGAAGTTAAVTPAPAPTVVAASTGYYSDAMLASALSGTVKSGTSIYFKVTFSENMKHTKSSTSGLPEISGLLSLPGLIMNAQRLGILDAGDALTNGNCKPNHASNTDVYICHVVTVSSLDAEGTRIGLQVGAESVNKAGNALASVYNHASQLTIDNRGPAVEFPPGAPTVGTAASITLKDATSKVAKYGIVEVDGASTTAVGCDDPSSTGDNFSTTAVSPAATPKVVMHTPATAGKKICVYAEDGVGNSRAQLWTTAIAATDNIAPTVVSGSTGYFSNEGATTALTGTQGAGTDIYTKVTFSEDMKHVKSDGNAARPALFRRIGATDTRYDIVDAGDTLASGDCRPNHASNTNVYVCLYTVGSSDSGAFGVKAGTDSVDKADNALAADYVHGATLTLDTSAPPPPPSGPNKLVGNVAQPASAHPVTFKFDAAQWFRTGRHPGGYRLTHVDIRIKDGSSTTPSYTVKIHAPRSTVPHSTGSGLPGNALGTLTNPGSLPKGGGFVRFAASGNGIDLASRSNYFVVIDAGSAERRVVISTAASSALDRDSVAEWGFHDVSWKRLAGSTGSWVKKGPSPRLQMAVYGTAKAAPPPAPEKVPSGAIWSASLTVDYMGGGWPYYGCGHWNAGFVKCAVVLSDDDFVHGGVAYRIHALEWNAREKRLGLDLGPDHDASVLTTLGSLTLHVDGRTFAFSDARFNGAEGIHWPWDGPWREGQFVSLALTDSGTPSMAPEASAPALEWARVNGAELALRFDQGLDETSLPAAAAFSVSVAGAPRAVSSVGVSQDLVTLTLAEPVSSGEAVTVGYAPPSSGKLRLSGGGAAVAAFSGQEVRNDTPSGQPQQSSPPGAVDPLTASVSQAPSEHRGKGRFEVRIAFSEAVTARAKDAAIQVTGGTLARAVRVDKRKDLWALTLEPSGSGAVTVTLPATSDCAAAGAICTADGRRLETALTHTVQGAVTLSVADASAQEGAGATVDFAVTLSRAAPGKVTVRYATKNGTAKKGKDYRNAKGKLVFAAGETSKTVSVAVLDDAHDEGTETFRLVLSKPKGAVIADGEAVGTITNSDPLQKEWLARFGRAAAADAVAAITARLETPRDAGSHLTLAGQRVDLSDTDGGAAREQALTGFARLLGASCGSGPEPDPDGWPDRGAARDSAGVAACAAPRLTGRALLLGSSFRAVMGGSAGAQWTSWGQGASVSQFASATPTLSLSGETATGSLGMDYERGRLLTGFAMTHSLGEGTAQGAGRSYVMGSSVTTMLPYMRYALSDRLSAWGLAGAGSGRMTLAFDGDAPERYGADLSMTLAAMGVRGELVTPAQAGGFALALKADAFWVRTESESASAPDGGNLAGARSDASRVRAVLDGSRSFALAGGAALTPSLSLGLRHDGGDAETGTGFELGAGLGYADPSRGLDAALKVHGLAAHAERGYNEWGVSGSLRLVPGAAGRGLSASLTPSWGADPGGSERLWAMPDASGLAANDNAPLSRRLDAEAGYGIALFGGGFTGTPNVGMGLSDTARELRLGWRLAPAGDAGDFEVHLDATRREAANDNAPPEHGIGLRMTARW